jgi:hypothetical protein
VHFICRVGISFIPAAIVKLPDELMMMGVKSVTAYAVEELLKK